MGKDDGDRVRPTGALATEARRGRVLRYQGLQFGVELWQKAEGLRQAQMLFVGGVAVVGRAEVVPGAGEPFGAGLVPEGERKTLGARAGRRAGGAVGPEDRRAREQ